MSTGVIQPAISALVSQTIRVVQASPVSGGCIHSLYRVRTSDEQEFAVKIAIGSNGAAMLLAEQEGLAAIAATRSIGVPQTNGVWQEPGGQSAVMVMQWIEPGKRPRDFGSRLAGKLFELHQAVSSDGKFGFAKDNFIGNNPQENNWTESWTGFWRERRLMPQLQMARDRGAPSELLRLGEQLAGRLEKFLDPKPAAALLHGDLWSGNVLADRKGEPVLIDPAVYYGAPEAELGMTSLFGDFGDGFLREYIRLAGLPAGWEDRVAIYRLYHLLNHFNLFGGSYLNGCLDLLRHLAR